MPVFYKIAYAHFTVTSKVANPKLYLKLAKRPTASLPVAFYSISTISISPNEFVSAKSLRNIVLIFSTY